jgi:hypothetical protein
MNHKRLFIILSTLLVLLLVAGCSQKKEENASAENMTKTDAPPSMSQGSSQDGPATVAGVEWTVPAGWTAQPPRQMRVATYTIPGSENAECAIFFFGSGEGGNKQANIDRWANQFEGSPKAEQSEEKVGDITVTIVRIAGTYLAPSGPMMQSQGKRENQRLLGAIVDAPGGAVFFKSVGPAATIGAAEAAFEGMIKSLKRSAAK